MTLELVTIGKYDDNFEADLAKALLEDHGIQAFLTNELTFSMAPGILPSQFYIELQVASADEERARALLDRQLSDSGVRSLLISESAILEGHFQLTSGKHSASYVEKIRLLQNPQAALQICEQLAAALEPYEFDTVAGPAYGGIVLAFEVARILGRGFLFTQRHEGQMSVRSGFDLSEVKNAVVIEDIVTTGGSVREVINCLRAMGIAVPAVAAIVDRSGGRTDFGCPFVSLLTLEIPTWEAAECPLCLDGVPLTKPGSSDKKV